MFKLPNRCSICLKIATWKCQAKHRISIKSFIQKRTMESVIKSTLEDQYKKEKKKNIWNDSEWKHIAELENDGVGNYGEQLIQKICEFAKIPSDINGSKTKNQNGGDGLINGKSVEIKTARLGCSAKNFQHELGEFPWKSDYMLFLDIAPKVMYITLFPNFSEEFYRTSGKSGRAKCPLPSSGGSPKCDCSNYPEFIKCGPYFPNSSICWRKHTGAFKLDTRLDYNEKSTYTFKLGFREIKSCSVFTDFADYINNIIHP